MSSMVLKKKKRGLEYRQWTDKSMLGALQAVRDGSFGVNRAALEYAVPRTTLKDRISGRVTHGSAPGAKPYLSRLEEKELVDFLTTCSNMGYSKSRKEVLELVGNILKNKGKSLDKPISSGWWLRFLARWPNLRQCHRQSALTVGKISSEDSAPKSDKSPASSPISTPLIESLLMETDGSSTVQQDDSTNDQTQKNTPSSGSPTPRSPLSEILIVPNTTPSRRKVNSVKSCVHVPTSAESLGMLEEKQQQKKEEQEMKDKRKKDQEEKAVEREKEELHKKKKRKGKAIQTEQEKIRKEQERESKRNERRRSVKQWRPTSSSTSSSSTLKWYPRRKVMKTANTSEFGEDVCAVCGGTYADDVDESGQVTVDWIQCGASACAVWSHVNCLENHATGFVCAICSTVFQ